MYKPSEELRSLQLRCVDIVKDIDLFCRKNNIEYALCGGSAIGAHMYGGFIPWDDDMDLMMTRKNYKKFLRLWNKEKQQYELHHYSKIDSGGVMFAKIVDPNSTLVETQESFTKAPSGVFVDITVFDYASGKFFSKIKKKIAMLCWLLRISDFSKKKKRLFVLFNKMPRFIKCWFFKFSEFIISMHASGSQKLQEYWAMDGDSHLIQYPKELFDEYTDADFEGNSFRVLKSNYKYLTIAYNRTEFGLPEEEQYPHHYCEFMDLSMPYREYIKLQKEKETKSDE